MRQPPSSPDPQLPPPPADEPATLAELFEPPAPLTRRERSAVLARIHALMEYWGITLEDLLADPSPQAPLEPPPVKYRHPVTGETWDGQGPHPDWLRRALLQEGLRVEELRP